MFCEQAEQIVSAEYKINSIIGQKQSDGIKFSKGFGSSSKI